LEIREQFEMSKRGKLGFNAPAFEHHSHLHGVEEELIEIFYLDVL
jgi:hypothetical protein